MLIQVNYQRYFILFYAMKKKPDRKKKVEYNTEDVIKKLAKRMKSLRVSKGYSNYEVFAYENNFSRSQYGQYEKGSDIRFTSLLRIMNAFDITLEEFFSEGFDED